MKSIYKKVFPKPYVNLEKIDSTSFLFTNSMYDRHKGVTHILHHYDELHPNAVRFVGDVEIAMTSNDSITSLFSSEHRSNLRNQIMSQRKNNPSGLSDEQLSHFPSNVSYERDESVKAMRSNLDSFNSDVRMASMNVQSSNPPVEPQTSTTND